jgi:ABC-type sugar transport system ATPase subunit
MGCPTVVKASDSDEVIVTSGLTKVFSNGLKAVDALDLSVSGGEIFSLLGPNGAGKTTTVGMLTSRVIPTNGSASIADVDVVAHSTLAKQLIGVFMVEARSRQGHQAPAASGKRPTNDSPRRGSAIHSATTSRHSR